MNEIEKLAAIEEIKQLKAKYFLGVDTQDWDLLRREVLIPEISFTIPEFREQPFCGQDEVFEMFELGLKGMASVHHGHMPIIEITSHSTAKGVWAMEDRIYWAGIGAVGGSALQLHGFGHYHETYLKRSEGWRIETIRLTRLRKETRDIS